MNHLFLLETIVFSLCLSDEAQYLIVMEVLEMDFFTVFIATFMSQLCVWLIDRYFKKRWEAVASHVESNGKNWWNNLFSRQR